MNRPAWVFNRAFDQRPALIVRASNYARLVEIKRKYDPKNVLRLNQNIKPD